MKRWDYKKIRLNEAPRKQDDVDVLWDAGEEGWELVQILPNGIAYLKREVVPSVADSLEVSTEEFEDNVDEETESVADSREAARQVKPKYRDPATGETWSGRGRMASWLKRKSDAGEDIDDYLV